MSATTLRDRGRDFAAVRDMVDACTIKHPTGITPNLVNGVGTPTYSLVYSGPCKVKNGTSSSGQDVAEAHLAVLGPVVSIPMTKTALDVVEQDVVTITASIDPDLVGRVFRVTGPVHQTYLTARRLPCVEATS